MNAPCHRAIALAATLGACSLVRPDPEHGALFVGVALATDMAPDKLELGILPHRGPTHRWWALALFVAALTLPMLLIVNHAGERVLLPWALPVGLGALFGYGSHLYLADGWTKTGLPGDGGKRIHFAPKGWRVHTGRWSEMVVLAFASLACVALGYTLLPAETRTALAEGPCTTPGHAIRVHLSKSEYPHITAHIRHSWRLGYPHVLRIHRAGADERRAKLLERWQRVHPQPKGDGLDLDEAPAAMLRDRVRADVRPIPAHENRSAGASLGAQLRGYCDGTRVLYIFTA
jgi:hypothetical protein